MSNPFKAPENQSDPEIEGNNESATPRRVIEKSMTAMMEGRLFPPHLSKINENHLDKMLEIAKLEVTNDFENKKADRPYRIAYFIIALMFFSGLVYFLVSTNNADLLQNIIVWLILAAGGIGTGGGLAIYKLYYRNNGN